MIQDVVETMNSISRVGKSESWKVGTFVEDHNHALVVSRRS